MRSNELIQVKRNTLLAFSGDDFSKLNAHDQAWLLKLAHSYRVAKSDASTLSAEQIQELALRVDIIPVSLALAQAAVESGWGTSRFASQGNSLFGQWTWGEHAMKPTEQRAHLGDYGLAAYESPQESVIAYMHNLNSHNAYQAVRDIRTQLRRDNKPVSGAEMANGLLKYSEKGQEYVDLLHDMIRRNHLAAADSAYLKDMPALYLLPKSAEQ